MLRLCACLGQRRQRACAWCLGVPALRARLGSWLFRVVANTVSPELGKPLSKDDPSIQLPPVWSSSASSCTTGSLEVTRALWSSLSTEEISALKVDLRRMQIDPTHQPFTTWLQQNLGEDFLAAQVVRPILCFVYLFTCLVCLYVTQVHYISASWTPGYSVYVGVSAMGASVHGQPMA